VQAPNSDVRTLSVVCVVLDQEACSGALRRGEREEEESPSRVVNSGGGVVEMWNLAARTRASGTTVDRIVAHLHPWAQSCERMINLMFQKQGALRCRSIVV
jgi:hypothetical protein